MESTQAAVTTLANQADPAKWLADHEYVGYTYVSETCVVAEYLRTTTGHSHVVNGFTAMNLETRDTVSLPPHLTAFVKAFDRGDFPALISDA